LLLACVLSTPAIAQQPKIPKKGEELALGLYYGLVEAYDARTTSLRLKVLPTGRVLRFPKLYEAFHATPVGKHAIVNVADVRNEDPENIEAAGKERKVFLRICEFPEIEQALQPLLAHLQKARSGKLAEDFLVKAMSQQAHIPEVIRAYEGATGHLVVGRITCDGAWDPSKMKSWMKVLPEGYFVETAAHVGQPVGFWLDGFLPLEVVPQRPGPVENVRTIKLIKATAKDLGAVKADIRFEGGSPPKEFDVEVISLVATNSGLEKFLSDPPGTMGANLITLENLAAIQQTNLLPGRYLLRVRVSGADRAAYCTAQKEFRVTSGETTNLGEITLMKPREITWRHSNARAPNFSSKNAQTFRLLAGSFWGAQYQVLEPANNRLAFSNATQGIQVQQATPDQIYATKHRGYVCLGPGPLENYLDKDLRELAPPDPRKRLPLPTEPHIQLKPGNVFLSRDQIDNYHLFEVNWKAN